MARWTWKRGRSGPAAARSRRRRRRGSSRHQRGPVAQEVRRWSGRMSLSRNRKAAARRAEARRLRPDGAALVGGQGDQARRQGHGFDLRDQTGQGGVGGAVVQHDDLDGRRPGGLFIEQPCSSSDGSSRRKGISTDTAGRATALQAALSMAFAAWGARSCRRPFASGKLVEQARRHRDARALRSQATPPHRRSRRHRRPAPVRTKPPMDGQGRHDQRHQAPARRAADQLSQGIGRG
jgi:hypothetical protein